MCECDLTTMRLGCKKERLPEPKCTHLGAAAEREVHAIISERFATDHRIITNSDVQAKEDAFDHE